MTSKKKRRVLTLLYMNLALTLVTIGSFTYTTFSWFITNRKATVLVNSIQVDIPGFSVEYIDTYAVDILTKGETSTSVTFLNQEITTIPRYDPEGISFSPYQKAIVVHVTFTYLESEAVNFYASTDNLTFSTGTLGSGDTDDNFTSNAFQVTPSQGTTLTSGWTSATLSYLNSDSKAFVSFDPTPSKIGEVSIKTINPGDSELFFVIEYYQPALSYIESARFNNYREVIYHDDILYQVAM